MNSNESPITEIRSGSIGRPHQALVELWAYRQVVRAFAERSFRLKYKQAVLGVAWAVLQPLAFLVIFVVAFSEVFELEDGASYASVALAALVPWQFVSAAVTEGANSLLQQAAMLRKVYFPRQSPVVGSVLSTLPQLAIGLGLLVLLAPIVGAQLGWNSLFILPLSLLIMIPAAAIAMPLAAMNVYYRDVRLILPMGIQFWFFASPVAYPISTISENWQIPYAVINPVAGILDGFRSAYSINSAPDAALLLASVAGSIVYLVIGLLIFNSLERDMAEVV